MFSTEDDDVAFAKIQPLRLSGIAVEHAHVAFGRHGRDDDPHPVDTAVDDTAGLLGLDVEQELGGRATNKRLAIRPRRDLKRPRISGVPFFGGDEHPTVCFQRWPTVRCARHVRRSSPNRFNASSRGTRDSLKERRRSSSTIVMTYRFSV